MAQKVKPGMWCETCQTPVAGSKNRHRVRNTAAAVGIVTNPAVNFLFPIGLGFKKDRYFCPNCGQPVRKATARELKAYKQR